MNRRLFLILIIGLIVVGIIAVIVIINPFGGDDTPVDTPPDGEVIGEDGEPGVPPPTATPAYRPQQVVIARVDLPLGTLLTEELLLIEDRPDDNIALQREAGYIFNEPEEVLGRYTRVDINKGQAILEPMLALDPTNISAFGSDLALYIDSGDVAVAFPIDKFTGAAYAMRPGDFVDVLMTLRVVEIDPEFRTALPNLTQRVNQNALLEGQTFLFEPTVQGRLEFIPEINQVGEIVPSANTIEGQDFAAGAPIPKRVTQLTIQQSEVLWVGTWRDPRIEEERAEALQAAAGPQVEGEPIIGEEGEAPAEEEGIQVSDPTPTPFPQRYNLEPDVVILSMTSQEALALKWALERGSMIDLALRAQGDNSVFTTTSVSLPQIINDGSLSVPEESDFDLHPRVDEVPTPFLDAVEP